MMSTQAFDYVAHQLDDLMPDWRRLQGSGNIGQAAATAIGLLASARTRPTPADTNAQGARDAGSELTGKQWSAASRVFKDYADKYRAAQTMDEACRIGDVAPQQIYNAIIEATPPAPRDEPVAPWDVGPVAWLGVAKVGKANTYLAYPDTPRTDEYEWKPLYLHPAPIAADTVKPQDKSAEDARDDEWVMVPKRLTIEMHAAMDEYLIEQGHKISEDGCDDHFWDRLLAAAPPPNGCGEKGE